MCVCVSACVCPCVRVSVCACVCACVRACVRFRKRLWMSGPQTAAEQRISEWTRSPSTSSWHTAKHTLTSQNQSPQRQTPSQTHACHFPSKHSCLPLISPRLTHLSLLCSAALRCDSSLARRFTDEVKSTWPEPHSQPASHKRRVCAVRDAFSFPYLMFNML